MSSWNVTSTQTWQNSPCGERGLALEVRRPRTTRATISARAVAVALALDVGVDDAAEVELVVRARDVVRARRCATTSPRSSSIARSQKRSTADMSWVTKTIVLPASLSALELLEALLLEGGVADREHLVDEQDVGVDLDRDREAEPHAHARRVVLELEVDELLELGEGDDLVEALARLLAREPEHDRVDQHVLARGQLRVEADAELDERRQPAVDRDLALVGRVDARRGTSAACSCPSRCGRRCRRTRPARCRR